MIEMGLCVALGLLVILAKLPWRYKLLVVSNPVLVDVAVFTLLTALHWGTFSGVMVATIGALFCSLTLSLCARLIGRYQNGSYVRGMFDMGSKL